MGLLAACGEGPAAPERVAGGDGRLALEGGGEARAFERVVLVTLDTLRVDHVSSYGYPRATTPFLDSLAARGVRFERAMAAISTTAPSHATMLTGLVPGVHGVLQNGDALGAGPASLAAVLAEQGFETAAFLNVNFLTRIAASFGAVRVRAKPRDEPPSRGAEVVDAALEWLAHERRGARFFLWVHLYDPHRWKDLVLDVAGWPDPIWDGASPPDFLAHVAHLHGLPPPSPGEPYRVAWDVKEPGALDLAGAAGFLRCIDAYDRLTRDADQELARLYGALEALALPGRTLWVVTSDHGEGLASHGVVGHGEHMYQEQLHVPLVVHASDGSLGPRVVDELVGHVDLFPTLVALVGLEARGRPPFFEGRSLWPLLDGRAEGWTERALFAQRRTLPGADEGDLEDDTDGADATLMAALQDARHKLIVNEPGADELYDVAADPRELHELGADDARAAALRAALEERLRAFATLAPGSATEVPDELLEELRALGYVR